MKKYDTYKDSDMEWIGKIPEGWKVLKAKFVLKGLQDGTHGTHERVDFGQPLLSAKNVFNDGIHLYDKESYISEFDYNRIVSNGFPQKGDVLLSCVGTIGRCCIYQNDTPMAFQRSVAFLRPNNKIISKFLCYEVTSALYKGQLDKFAKTSAQSGIYLGDIAKTLLILPPLSDQISIVAYLDHKVSTIDKSVEIINTEIDNLKAYRQSLISEVVTKGLNPDVPMEDSGVEWIGDIPQGWSVRKLKTLLEHSQDSLRVGPFGSSLSGNDFTDFGYYVYNQRVILDNDFDNGNTFISEDKYNKLKSFSVREGDILVTTRGTIGKVTIVPPNAPEGILHPCVIKFRLNNELALNEYIKYFFNDSNLINEQVKYNSNATTIQVIYSYTLKELKFTIPPLSEQKAIAIYLDNKTSKIDETIRQLESQRDDLNALKQSVINEAVSGEIDVRDWKSNNEQ